VAFQHKVIDGNAKRSSPEQQRACNHQRTQPARPPERGVGKACAQPALDPVMGSDRQRLQPPVAFQQGVCQGQSMIAPADRGIRVGHG
jgi:hypothetical protein